jgi:undecaprenyl-diphosphatase
VSAYFWVPTLVFLYLANHIKANGPLPGDIAVLNALRQLSSPTLDTAMIAITTLGSAVVVIAGVAIATGILAYLHRRRQAVFLLFSAAGTGAINIGFKYLFQRDRPSLWQQIVTENGFSFPSGHAMISSALALSVILICWNTRYRVWAIVGGSVYFLLVGLSRLYLGVHFPSDVLGGWCVSLLWILTLHYAFDHFGKRRNTSSTTVPGRTT